MFALSDRLAVRPAEAARMLGISTRTLWSLSAPRGPIPTVKTRQAVLYSVADLRAWLKQAGQDSLTTAPPKAPHESN